MLELAIQYCYFQLKMIHNTLLNLFWLSCLCSFDDFLSKTSKLLGFPIMPSTLNSISTFLFLSTAKKMHNVHIHI